MLLKGPKQPALESHFATLNVCVVIADKADEVYNLINDRKIDVLC